MSISGMEKIVFFCSFFDDDDNLGLLLSPEKGSLVAVGGGGGGGGFSDFKRSPLILDEREIRPSTAGNEDRLVFRATFINPCGSCSTMR